MKSDHQDVLDLLAAVTSATSKDRIPLKEIRSRVGMTEGQFRSFRKGKHPSGLAMRKATLDKKAQSVLRAIHDLQREGRSSPLAYSALKAALDTSESSITTWADTHCGAYICYRYASSEGLMQVSRLDIFDSDGRPRFRQAFKITNPQFGEPNERVVEGDVHPLSRCAHFIYAAHGQFHHYVYSHLQGLSPRYMVGIVSGLSTDGRYPFASRTIAVRFDDVPGADLPTVEVGIGILFPDVEEAKRAMTLDVVPGKLIPTIASLWAVDDDCGVIRGEISTRLPFPSS